MTIFTTTLKRILTQPLNWAFIMLFPVLLFVLINLTQADKASSGSEVDLYFGLADADGTELSKTLANQMALRYNVKEVDEADISAVLTEQEVTWVLRINKGYGESVLKGVVPRLDGFSLSPSDMSALGTINAENITKALLILGAGDPETLSEWLDKSKTQIEELKTDDNWGATNMWLGLFGFVSVFTVYFIVKTLNDDKLRGMPDRIGVLPVSPRNHLSQGVLAAFATTEITVALVFFAITASLGAVPNPAHLLILLSLYNLFAVSLVRAIFSLIKSVNAASMTMIMSSTIIAMLGGLLWPLEFVPDFMRKVAWFSPGYWLMRGIENIQEITFGGFGMPVLFLLGFTLVAVLIGGWKRTQKLEDE